jgi:hypothetical protein
MKIRLLAILLALAGVLGPLGVAPGRAQTEGPPASVMVEKAPGEENVARHGHYAVYKSRDGRHWHWDSNHHSHHHAEHRAHHLRHHGWHVTVRHHHH